MKLISTPIEGFVPHSSINRATTAEGWLQEKGVIDWDSFDRMRVAKRRNRKTNRGRKNYVSQGSEEDVGMKPTEVNKSGASDKGGEDEQDTRSEFERLIQQEKQTNSTNSFNTVGTLFSAVGPSFTNDDPSSPVNAVKF
ncbi:hypothetical protein Tco_0462307 [Tanacetum coccineum]